MRPLKSVLNLVLIILLLNLSCAQSEKQAEAKNTNSTKSASTIETPEVDIQTAIITDNTGVVKQHISAGTDLNKKDAMSGSTPLITAASFGKEEITKLLLETGVDLSLKNNDGATALHTAAFFCRVNIVELLLEAGADTSLRNNYGSTPRETVMGKFTDIKPIYEMLKQQFAPLGLEMDLNYIEQTRPTIAALLK